LRVDIKLEIIENGVFKSSTVKRWQFSSKGDSALKVIQHHYDVERDTGQICSERPIGDWVVNYLYSKKREEVPFVCQLLGSQWFSGFLGWVNYDFPLGQNITGIRRFLKNCAINLSECLDKPEELDSARKIF
jgi:phosphatidylserine decarboxylase